MRLYVITAPGKHDLYWKADRCGYTANLADIGIYSEEESKGIVNLGRGDTRIPLSHLMPDIIELRKKCREDADKITLLIRRVNGLKGDKD